MSEYSGPEEELKPHRRRAVGTVTTTTSGTLLATRADLEDKQVTTLVVSAGSGIGTRGGGDPGMWARIKEGNLVQKFGNTPALMHNSLF